MKKGHETVLTTSSIVDTYITDMKDALTSKDYGKVGIVFTVHDGHVVGVQEIRETKWINGDK